MSKYNRVIRDSRPGKYNLMDLSQEAIQFYFHFNEAFEFAGKTYPRVGVTVQVEIADSIPDGESAYETAVVIRDHYKSYLYSSSLPKMEAIVAHLYPHIDRDLLGWAQENYDSCKQELDRAESMLLAAQQANAA